MTLTVTEPQPFLPEDCKLLISSTSETFCHWLSLHALWNFMYINLFCLLPFRKSAFSAATHPVRLLIRWLLTVVYFGAKLLSNAEQALWWEIAYFLCDRLNTMSWKSRHLRTKSVPLDISQDIGRTFCVIFYWIKIICIIVFNNSSMRFQKSETTLDNFSVLKFIYLKSNFRLKERKFNERFTSSSLSEPMQC